MVLREHFEVFSFEGDVICVDDLGPLSNMFGRGAFFELFDT